MALVERKPLIGWVRRIKRSAIWRPVTPPCFFFEEVYHEFVAAGWWENDDGPPEGVTTLVLEEGEKPLVRREQGRTDRAG